jgi:hypothetical protein
VILFSRLNFSSFLQFIIDLFDHRPGPTAICIWSKLFGRTARPKQRIVRNLGRKEMVEAHGETLAPIAEMVDAA